MKLSISIISFNEEENIGRTLSALQGLADEIILVDSNSTDSTVAIAESMGAKVYSEAWKGHIAQKNSALEKCTGDWIFAVDSDEVVTPELANSIREAMQECKFEGYTVNRRTFYLGRLLKYGWQPDRKLRLVKRGAGARWQGYDPHDVLEINAPKGRLNGDLIHYSFKDFGDHMERTIKHSRVAAKSYYEKGKSVGIMTFLFKPWWVFFNKLVLKRALLDGVPGVLAAFSSAAAVYMKYGFLWEMRHRGPE